MKKIFFTLTLSFLTATLFAQSFGVRAGINIANVNVQTQGFSIKPSAKVGLNAGVFLNFKLAPLVSLQPELAYSSMGYKISGSGISDGTANEDYLTLPVLVKVKIPATGLHFYAGPQYGVLLSAKVKQDGTTTDDKDNYKSGEFAGVVGAEYNLKLGLFFSARYQFGLSNINKNTDEGTVKNNSVSLLVGFKF